MNDRDQADRTDRTKKGMSTQTPRPIASLRWSSRSTRPRLVSFSWAAVTPSRRKG